MFSFLFNNSEVRKTWLLITYLDGILVSGFDWFNDRLYAPVILDNIWNRKFDLKGAYLVFIYD